MGTGVGWSATTPLWYTLQASNKFVHAGIEKEIEYLLNISDTKRNLLKKLYYKKQKYRFKKSKT